MPINWFGCNSFHHPKHFHLYTTKEKLVGPQTVWYVTGSFCLKCEHVSNFLKVSKCSTECSTSLHIPKLVVKLTVIEKKDHVEQMHDILQREVCYPTGSIHLKMQLYPFWFLIRRLCRESWKLVKALCIHLWSQYNSWTPQCICFWLPNKPIHGKAGLFNYKSYFWQARII
jgi:hypothetical protein